jgi:2,4-dienoyl-CoA reductase-like NADH-dependent reductase (Old Yellow Enzyme family)
LPRIRAGHGYLLHEFLSPIASHRFDEYGGSAAGKAKFALEVITEVHAVWPEDKPLMIRVSAEDCIDGGITLEDTDDLVKHVISSAWI